MLATVSCDLYTYLREHALEMRGFHSLYTILLQTAFDNLDGTFFHFEQRQDFQYSTRDSKW